MYVRPKKRLGQHFLKDDNIARKIVQSLTLSYLVNNILEIGPGTGVLTKYLLNEKKINLKVIEVDLESIDYLNTNYPELQQNIIHADFLDSEIFPIFNAPFSVIGNFPYNISSQILFKILEHRQLIPEVVGMFQKEVALRIAAHSGSKEYGILSVLIQTYYKIDYLFTVSPNVFNPPPKVQSAVIRLSRNDRVNLDCDEALFIKVVKTAFNQRRKMLRNALGVFGEKIDLIPPEYLTLRAERLEISDYIEITKKLI